MVRYRSHDRPVEVVAKGVALAVAVKAEEALLVVWEGAWEEVRAAAVVTAVV